MKHLLTRPAIALAVMTLVSACSDSERVTSPSEQTVQVGSPRFTAGVGFGGALLGRATVPDGAKLKRKNGKWEFDLNAKDAFDISVQSLTVQAGGSSGWHSHSGPVILQVTSGAMTFYESDDPSCTPVVKTAGQVFIETGEHSHLGRNEGTSTATAIATVFSPVGGSLRIDEPASGNCPF